MKFTFEEISSPGVFESLTRQHAAGSVFVGAHWLQFAQDMTGGRFIGLKIRSADGAIGFFAGILFRKFGIKIVGAPFRGWGTSYMGLFGHLKPDESLVRALVQHLFDGYKAHYVEMINPPGPEPIKSCDAFSVTPVESLQLDLTPGVERLHAQLKGDCRTYLRQFEARGGTVVVAEPDQMFVDAFYDQLTEVFGRQGMVPTYSKERVVQLLATLAAGNAEFLCLQAFSADNKHIASSIFFGANGVFYYWAGASYSAFQYYRPSESMIWHAIRHFAGLGYQSFDMMGVRDYKLKFSPEPIHYNKVVAARLPLLLSLRNLAERAYYALNKLTGKLASAGAAGQAVKLSPNLVLKGVEQYEFAHYRSDELSIYSRGQVVYIVRDGVTTTVKLPLSGLMKVLCRSRLFRRASRLDKSCVLPTDNGLIIFWQGGVYHWSEQSGLRRTLTLQGCRNPMHNCVARIDGLTYVFGDYGRPHPEGKNLYQTCDGGQTWKVVFNFPADQIRHVHNCTWDPVEGRLWVFTGDFDGQCKVLSANRDCGDVRYYGDGSQLYRATGVFVERNFVHWIMDSPLQEVRHVKLNKATGEITLGQSFPGPAYYYARTSDGVYLVCTAQEPGPSLTDKSVHVFASRNLKKWVNVGSFEHDGLPMRVFRFGVGVFPDGEFASDDFLMSFDSVKKYDGKVLRLCIKGV
jgi:CelD/BcsL family acetyltransferase involved in cellulose biosynthesis